MERKTLDLGTSVIVPVYNAEKTIEDLIHRLFPVLESLNGRFELILINDGSGDRSWELIRKFAEQHPWIRGFNLMRNYGQHNALLCGIRSAKYAIAVTLDDDLQNPPEEIPKLLRKLAEGFDLVYGVPLKEQHGLWRNLASRITKIALRTATGVPSTTNVSAFRAFHTRVRDAFDHYQSPFLSLDVLITWGTVRIGAVDVIHEPRGKGDTNYTFRMLIIHALNMITGFSILPLQLASIIGFGFTLFGLLVFLYVIGRYLVQGGAVPGFPFLASIIAIFSGAQLFALGIFGEYLARIHFRTMDRPAYVVRDDTGPK